MASAQARAIARANTVEAALDLTAKDPAEAAEPPARPAPWWCRPDRFARSDGPPTYRRFAGFDAGRQVQDAAQPPCRRLLGDVAGKTVVDLCAAPGGKTMQLAAAGARSDRGGSAPSSLEAGV
ncbi:MAG: hypothetical protein R3C40_07385 [Parvularculaceae bacterium]